MVPWAENKFEFNTIVIFEIDPEKIQPSESYKLCISEWAIADLEWLQKNVPEDYVQVLELIESIGLDMNTLRSCKCRIRRGQHY